MARMADAAGFGAGANLNLTEMCQAALDKPEWGPLEKEMLVTIDIEKRLAVERATVEK